MMKPIVVKLAAAAVLVALAGCTDLKPLRADIDNFCPSAIHPNVGES